MDYSLWLRDLWLTDNSARCGFTPPQQCDGHVHILRLDKTTSTPAGAALLEQPAIFTSIRRSYSPLAIWTRPHVHPYWSVKQDLRLNGKAAELGILLPYRVRESESEREKDGQSVSGTVYCQTLTSKTALERQKQTSSKVGDSGRDAQVHVHTFSVTNTVQSLRLS